MKRRKKSRKGIFKKKSLYGIVLAIIILSIAFIYSTHHSLLNQKTTQTFQLKAAIVDHLSLSCPNKTFIQTATNTLKQAGYRVDYYSGEKVSVEFYRNLPTHGYGLIILRVHSALGRWGEPPVALFTSESYEKTKYVHEQLTGRLQGVAFSEDWEKGIIYFGIMPSFVGSSMNGRFDNTIIIMMGCNGLTYTDMAKAFVEKGAKVFISWSRFVSAFHTDLATTSLLQHFLLEKLTLKETVRETFKEVGFDPAYNSLLIYYPLEAGDYTIQKIMGN